MIYLIGVNHCYQFANDEYKSGAKILESYLFEVIEKESIEAIVEEFNDDARKLWNATKVVGEDVARTKELIHAFCEPSLKERKELGIEGQNGVLKRILGVAFDPKEKNRADVQKAMAEDFEKREAFWFDVLEQYLEKNTILICGHQHIDSFSCMLNGKKCGFAVLGSFTDIVK